MTFGEQPSAKTEKKFYVRVRAAAFTIALLILIFPAEFVLEKKNRKKKKKNTRIYAVFFLGPTVSNMIFVYYYYIYTPPFRAAKR